jgi:hypothetical protein
MNHALFIGKDQLIDHKKLRVEGGIYFSCVSKDPN